MSRISKFTPDLGDKIIELMEQGLTATAAAAKCGLHRQRLYEYAKQHDDFGEALELAKGLRQAFWEYRLMGASDAPIVTSSIFALKCCGEDWRERADVNIDPKGGITVTISPNDAKL